MGKDKKKKKKKEIKEQSREYNREELSKMADALEQYFDIFDRCIICEHMDEEKYEKNMKIVRKLIKKLREGDGDSVFDLERYDDMMARKNNLMDNFYD